MLKKVTFIFFYDVFVWNFVRFLFCPIDRWIQSRKEKTCYDLIFSDDLFIYLIFLIIISSVCWFVVKVRSKSNVFFLLLSLTYSSLIMFDVEQHEIIARKRLFIIIIFIHAECIRLNDLIQLKNFVSTTIDDHFTEKQKRNVENMREEK